MNIFHAFIGTFQLSYDHNFGSLVRLKSKYPLDGVPLAVGMACLLKQFHPVVTKKLLAYLGQFVRGTIQQVYSDTEAKAIVIPHEVLNALIFIEHLCRYTSVPRAVVHAFIPSYIFDSLKYPAASTAKK